MKSTFSIIGTIGRTATRAFHREAQSLPPVSEEVKQAFSHHFDSSISQHPACKHSLFPTMVEMAHQGRLTAEGFKRYRHGMFSRVFTTVPSLFEMGKQAALRGDYTTTSTVTRNIMEECAEGNISLMHPLLMEKSFNALGREVFGLAPVSMRDCFERPHLPEAVIYRHTVMGLYERHGPLVSYMQEFASGGNNNPSNPGMMGDMYKLFHAYHPNVPRSLFMQTIRPYFAFHISLDKQTHEQVFTGDAIEFQHGERAKEDALRMFKTADDVERSLPVMHAFLKVQADFMDAILQDVEKAQTIGTGIAPAPTKAAPARRVVPFTAERDRSSHLPADYKKPKDFRALAERPAAAGKIR